MSSKKKNPQKFFNFKPDEIKEYLNKFRKCIIDGNYSISQNEHRQENIDFIEDFKIDTKKEHEILLGLQFDDFCHAVENQNTRFSHEVLYIFCKQYELDFWGTPETVGIYIKVNMIENQKGDLYTILVSFHRRNFEIAYLFK